jgi:uncharacterized protein
LTAGIGGTIIRNIIIPEFKAGSYYRGLDKGADALLMFLKANTKVNASRLKEKIFQYSRLL